MEPLALEGSNTANMASKPDTPPEPPSLVRPPYLFSWCSCCACEIWLLTAAHIALNFWYSRSGSNSTSAQVAPGDDFI